MPANTFCHVFTVDGGAWQAALTFAARRYQERWGLQPFNVFVHPDAPALEAPGLAVLPDERIPARQLWLEVPAQLAMGGNGR